MNMLEIWWEDMPPLTPLATLIAYYQG